MGLAAASSPLPLCPIVTLLASQLDDCPPALVFSVQPPRAAQSCWNKTLGGRQLPGNRPSASEGPQGHLTPPCLTSQTFCTSEPLIMLVPVGGLPSQGKGRRGLYVSPVPNPQAELYLLLSCFLLSCLNRDFVPSAVSDLPSAHPVLWLPPCIQALPLCFFDFFLSTGASLPSNTPLKKEITNKPSPAIALLLPSLRWQGSGKNCL